MISNKYRIGFLVAVFLVIIAFPVINDKLGLVKDIESKENRKMAAKPVMDFTYLDPYPAKYEKFYNDNFSIRSIMVKYFNLLNIEFFKKSPLPDKVVIGKDNWLFMAEKELDSYQGLKRFSEEELEAFNKEFEYRIDYLKERNCKYYFMVAPIKANIYSEYMPSTIFQVKKQSWGEQLNEYLEKNSRCKPVNVYDFLREKKDEELVYFKLDNHWNQLGAFYCAQEFFKRLKVDFPDTKIPSLEDYTITKTEITNGNIVSMLSNIGGYSDIAIKLEPRAGFKAKDVKAAGYPVIPGFPYPGEYEFDKEVPGSSQPRIVIIADSYGKNIFPFIADNFSRSVKIFDAWQYKLNEDVVNAEKPDVVLVIALESNLRSLLKFATTNPVKPK
jgi:alginate O-acetyltransferase complex protein AlgJ